MCSIIAWKGELPPGFVAAILVAGECRGTDSTGIAYRDVTAKHNKAVKHVGPARKFVNTCKQWINLAELAPSGIGHTRNASPNMPITVATAHPFVYQSVAFAHNGFVRNWRELLHNYTEAAPEQLAEPEYWKACKTDSPTLGPALMSQDFTEPHGSMGLVWLSGDQAFAFRSRKELVAAKISWTPVAGGQEKFFTVVASTWDMIEKSLGSLTTIVFKGDEVILFENRLYELTPTDVVDHGLKPVNPHNATDAHSSSSVKLPPETDDDEDEIDKLIREEQEALGGKPPTQEELL